MIRWKVKVPSYSADVHKTRRGQNTVVNARRGPHWRILRPVLFSAVINQTTVTVLFMSMSCFAPEKVKLTFSVCSQKRRTILRIVFVEDLFVFLVSFTSFMGKKEVPKLNAKR